MLQVLPLSFDSHLAAILGEIAGCCGTSDSATDDEDVGLVHTLLLSMCRTPRIISHRQPVRKRPPQNTTRLSPILFRSFALERFQGLKCKSHVVTCLPEWESGSRSGCLPVFIRYRRMQMTRQAKDEAREQRIHMEITVDAYGPA